MLQFPDDKRTNWVTGSNDGASGLERGDNASFGDGNTLLLHGFVDARPVCIGHLRDKEGEVMNEA